MSSEGAETETSMSVASTLSDASSVTLPLSESVAALGEQFTAEDNDVDVVDDVSNVVEGVDALPVAQKKKNRRKPHGKKAAKSVAVVDGVVEAVVDKRVVEVDVNELLVSGSRDPCICLKCFGNEFAEMTVYLNQRRVVLPSTTFSTATIIAKYKCTMPFILLPNSISPTLAQVVGLPN